jgi:hypothetical protein
VGGLLVVLVRPGAAGGARALGRDDVWGIGLPMSVAAISDTDDELLQFQIAYGAPWLGNERRPQIDDP